MCGIAGLVLPEGEAPASSLVREALLRMRHRGPDDLRVEELGGAAIGAARLSIIDVAGGIQPVFDETRSVAAVLNGEIYNHASLRAELGARGHLFRSRVDTELLPHLWEERGTALVSRLRGMFALAVWDAREKALLLSRDRFGKKPLYTWDGGRRGFAFASEIKGLLAILAGLGVSPSVNPQAIYDFLTLGCVPQPETVYKGIRSVGAGTWLLREDGGSREETYWAPSAEPMVAISRPEAAEEVRKRVRDAVKIRLESDVPVGIFLSGGVDSGVVAVEAARSGGGHLPCFTVSFPGSSFDESGLAASVAKRLGLRHEVLEARAADEADLRFVARHWDQPFADSSAIPSLLVSRAARERVKVVLNGDGGDEVFGGYRRYRARALEGSLARLPGFRSLGSLGRALPFRHGERGLSTFAKRFLSGLDLNPAARYLHFTMALFSEAEKRAAWRGGEVRPTEEWVASVLPDGGDLVTGHQLADMRINLVSDLLVKMDMATMAASLEARSPLLDHELAELVLKLPPAYRANVGQTKSILREAYRNDLPATVLEGPKRGFEVPLRSWLSGPWSTTVRETLLAKDSVVSRFLDPAWVNGVWTAGPKSVENWTQKAFALLALELWGREVPVSTSSTTAS